MRTGKTGLDYFPLDVDFFNDEKIEFVSAKYGELGENVCIKLLCRIYRNGYFLPWDDDAALLFAKRAGDKITTELVAGVVQELLKRGFLSQHHFDQYGILTSNGIQKRFLEAVRRRKQASMQAEYLIADITGFDVNIIPQNEDIGTQRRGEERRVEERRGEEKKEIPPIGSFRNVKLTEEELQKLKERFTEQGAQDRIERLSEGIASKGYKYKSHYATILSWERRRKEGGNGADRPSGKRSPQPERFDEKQYVGDDPEKVSWMRDKDVS